MLEVVLRVGEVLVLVGEDDRAEEMGVGELRIELDGVVEASPRRSRKRCCRRSTLYARVQPCC